MKSLTVSNVTVNIISNAGETKGVQHSFHFSNRTRAQQFGRRKTKIVISSHQVVLALGNMQFDDFARNGASISTIVVLILSTLMKYVFDLGVILDEQKAVG